jgi:two-component system cell cycle sensor histidine kinase/response regulator CckA
MPTQREQSVLVVDDEPSIARMVTLWLERAGYKVAGTALNGNEGLELFRGLDRVDLVISDVVMPQLNGPDMVREMLGEQPDLRVLFMTGYSDRTVGASIEKLPFEVIRKPFTPEHLLARVRDTLH